MANYILTDGHCNEICAGLSDPTADAAAQRWANRLGRNVYLSRSDGHGAEVCYSPDEDEPSEPVRTIAIPAE